MEVAGHPDESFLNQVLGPISVARLPGDEVDEAVSVAFVQFSEGFAPTVEVRRH
jgi:hypothetical protein